MEISKNSCKESVYVGSNHVEIIIDHSIIHKLRRNIDSSSNECIVAHIYFDAAFVLKKILFGVHVYDKDNSLICIDPIIVEISDIEKNVLSEKALEILSQPNTI